MRLVVESRSGVSSVPVSGDPESREADQQQNGFHE